MPFRQYAPFFEPEELDKLTAAFKLAQRILVSATAGGIRDVETLKEQALRSLSGGICRVGEPTSEAA